MAAFEELQKAGLGKLISADSQRGASSVSMLSCCLTGLIHCSPDSDDPEEWMSGIALL